ncbi:MAG TPA: hypothetical protein VEI07_15080 [Planctomycetaceae bacterium]|nr:hypothetical protein [Planctomycetaceae bacterium]
MVKLLSIDDQEIKCDCGKPSQQVGVSAIANDSANVAILFRCPDQHDMLKEVPVVTEHNIEQVKAKFADSESVIVYFR